nr:hypothetical protein [Oculatellaceae cyanobacterium Prado106]
MILWSAIAERDDNPKLKVRDVDELVFGSEAVDLSGIEQIVDVGQLRAIGAAIAYLQSNRINGRHTLADLIETLITDIQTHSLD